MTMSPESESAVQGQCDLCEAPMAIPAQSVRAGRIIGLLVCTQCVEDNLSASTFNARSEVGLARSGGGR